MLDKSAPYHYYHHHHQPPQAQLQSTEVPSRPSVRPNTGPWLRPERVNPWSSSCGLEAPLQSTCWLSNRQGVMVVLQHYTKRLDARLRSPYSSILRASIVDAARRYDDGTIGTSIRTPTQFLLTAAITFYKPKISPRNLGWHREAERHEWSLPASQPRAESDAWKHLRQAARIALPATRGCNARLMSWGKAYLEPYHAATRYDLDSSHASPAFVQKANTGKMNKEGI
ncbi:hypothetical protein Landi51_13042 [Colletotrichum acutatum]